MKTRIKIVEKNSGVKRYYAERLTWDGSDWFLFTFFSLVGLVYWPLMILTIVKFKARYQPLVNETASAFFQLSDAQAHIDQILAELQRTEEKLFEQEIKKTTYIKYP